MGKDRPNGVTKEQQIAQDTRIWELRRHGYSQPRIAKELGISQPTVSRALKRLGNRYQKELMKDVAALKAQQIEQLEHIRDDAMEAWRRSQEDYEETTTRTQQIKDAVEAESYGLPYRDWQPPDEDEEGEGPAKNLEFTTVVRRGQVGDPRFLKIAMETSAEIRKITGIDNSNRLYAMIFEQIDWEKLTPTQLKRLESGEDPLAVILGA